jgi:hypothetical protein
MFEKIILALLEYWAEKYEILSPTQYGFRKGHGTRDYVALLLTAIQPSFDYKQSTLVGCLDISGAYDNVFIDILCDQMYPGTVTIENCESNVEYYVAQGNGVLL